jgi:transcriptional regulator with XRE-family HTH domain
VPNDSLHRHIATRIRSLAERRNWSGNHLADIAGVSRAQMSRLLTLQTSPTIGLLAKIAAALEVSPRDLLPRAS